MKITVADMTISQKRKLFIGILMIFMFAGVIAGTLFVIIDTEKNYVISNFFNQRLIKSAEERTLFRVFIDSFLPLFIILVFQMICGFFAIGQPLCFITLLHRGIAGGISAALIYSSYGIRGFLIIVIMLLPAMIFSMFILVLSARESIKLSNIIASFAFGKQSEEKTEIRLYIIKFLVLTIFALICAILDSALTYIFTGLLLKQ